MTAAASTHRPNRVPWPPLILAGVVAAGMLAGHLFPMGLSGDALQRPLGVVTVVAGLGLDVAAMVTMARHRANILPHRAATALVTSGPFAISRNPIYLGNAILTVGLALAWGNAWLLVGAVVEVALVTLLAIVREEAHLHAVFGSEFEDYKRRTSRWIGRQGHKRSRSPEDQKPSDRRRR